MGKNKADIWNLFDIKAFSVIIFPSLIVYIITLSLQDWQNPFFFLFPILTIFLGLYLYFYSMLEDYGRMDISRVAFHPFGKEIKRLSMFLGFIGFLEFLIIYFLGVESIERPQLLDDYGQYIPLIMAALYLFPWIFAQIIITSNCSIIFNSRKNQNNEFKNQSGDSNRSKLGKSLVESSQLNAMGGNKYVEEMALFRLSPKRIKGYAIITLSISFFLLILLTIDTFWIIDKDIIGDPLIIHLPGSDSPFPQESDPTIAINILMPIILGVEPIFFILIIRAISSTTKKISSNLLVKFNEIDPTISDFEKEINRLMFTYLIE